jgi:hypothetical protein
LILFLIKGDGMKTLISVALVLAMAAVISCSVAPRASENAPDVRGPKSRPEDDTKEKVTINYDRVSCPTGCPGYSMVIRPDRSVEYEGRENTRVLGKRTYTISAEAYQAIIDAFKLAQVERLADEYESVPGRDGGTVILKLSWDGKTKQITHFIPSPDVPEELIALEVAIVRNSYPGEKPAPQ